MAVIALFFAGILAIQTPQMQTYISKLILKSVEGKIDADISFDKIHIKPFNTLVLKNVAVKDRAPVTGAYDTLFKAGYVIARFSLAGLGDKQGFHIGRAYIKNARMDMVIEEERTNLERMFGIKKPETKKKQGKVFNARKVTIENMEFRMQNMKNDAPGYKGSGIDWTGLDIRNINIEAHGIELGERVMKGTLDFMSFKEKSGYECLSLSGSAKVGNGRCEISELKLTDLWSDIYLPSFIMKYENSSAFKDFIHKVRMEADIARTRLDMKTLSFFTPGLEDISLAAGIKNGTISGTVGNISISRLETGIGDEGIELSMDGLLKGLPDIESLYADIHIRSLGFSSASVERLVGGLSAKPAPAIGRYAPGTEFGFRGSMKGHIDNISVKGFLGSDIGSVSTDLKVDHILSSSRPTGISGKIATDGLDIGRIIGSNIIHECTMSTGVRAELGKDDPYVNIDSLEIKRLNINSYDYSNIAAAGTVAMNEFDGKIICNDPNLNFLFQGTFALSSKTKNSLYRFYANIGYADLYALNIDKRGISKIRLQTSANFNRIREGDMLGNIDIGGIVLENEQGHYDIGDITVSSHSGDNLFRMKMDSDFAEGSFIGSGPVTRFVKDLRNVTLKRELPSMFKDSTYSWNGNDYQLSFQFFDTMDLLSFLMPGLYIADNTVFNIGIDKDGVMNSRMKSSRIAFKEQYLKDIELEIDNRDGSFGGELRSETLNAASFTFKNNILKIFADDNHVGLGYTYDNHGERQNRGELYILGDISRTEDETLKYDLSLLPSSIYLNSREWNILPSEVSITGSDINVKNIEFTSGEQSVKIYGRKSAVERDTLSLSLDRFDMSVANPILGKDFSIEGAATGKAMLISPPSERGLLLNFICDSVKVSGSQMGTVSLASSWNEDFRRFDISLKNSLAGKTSFDIAGNYNPSIKRAAGSLVFDRFDISCIKPLVKDIFSESEGYISGRISAEGPVDKLDIESTGLRLEDTGLRIAFTNVPYRVDGGFHIDNYGVYFDSVTLKDRAGNTGEITGEIGYDHFKNIRFDTRINVDRIECLDLNEKMNSSFYGKLSATGTIAITGPINAMTMTVDAATAGNGQLHVPISSSANAGSSNLLTFKQIKKEEYIDPYEAMISRLKKKEKQKSDFAIRLRVAATPEIEALVEIDKATGNVLSGRGAGVIELEIRPSREIFNITGDYTLSSGNYRFVALGLASRDFSIKDGSSVKFNGNIMKSSLNIDAIYKTKTSLSTLIADTTSVSSRRAVECGIKITDKISNPRLQFSIEVPDLDPTTKARVENALSTEDKVQKQFLSLILSNSFIPDEQSGIVNNSTILYSNVSEIMSNQLNNIFQKLDIPLDLGLNYQPNERGNDIFDVAVSTQLFNNRVIVNGNIGNRQYSNSTSGDVVGDLDIEVKLDSPGALRLNIFSHSADQYTNYLDNSQRNGIGLTYQQEFNNFKEFIRNMFSGKKKKEAAQRKAEKDMLNAEKVTIKIQKDNKIHDRKKRKAASDTVSSGRE